MAKEEPTKVKSAMTGYGTMADRGEPDMPKHVFMVERITVTHHYREVELGVDSPGIALDTACNDPDFKWLNANAKKTSYAVQKGRYKRNS